MSTNKRPAVETLTDHALPFKQARRDNLEEDSAVSSYSPASAQKSSPADMHPDESMQAPLATPQLSTFITGLFQDVAAKTIGATVAQEEAWMKQTNDLEHSVKGLSENVTALTTERDEALVGIGQAETACETAKKNVRDLKKQIRSLESEQEAVATRTSFDRKIKELKAEQRIKITELKNKAAKDFNTAVEQWKQRVAEAVKKGKVDVAISEGKGKGEIASLKAALKQLKDDMVKAEKLATNEKAGQHRKALEKLNQDHKAALKAKEDSMKEVYKAKETIWKSEIAELKEKHKEQLAKARANSKMVEAAEKVMRLNQSASDAAGDHAMKVE